MLKASELNLLNVETPTSERKYREGFRNKYKQEAIMLCYVDARYVMDTFDKIAGKGNWFNEYVEIKGNLFCKITVYFEREDGTISSISKMDCGTESNVEKEKGESSDAFKRASVHFGIARDLYSLPEYKCKLESFKDSNGKLVYYVPKNWKPEIVTEKKYDNF